MCRSFLKEMDKQENQWYLLLEKSKKCVKRFEMAAHVGPIIKGRHPKIILKREGYATTLILSTVGFCHVGKR